jgi:hypothetical protein
MRDVLVACLLILATIAACSMPNFGPPKLGVTGAPAAAAVSGTTGPH